MLDQIRIVLVNTSHTGNMGSAARAMKTMGLTQLVLVDPQAQPDEEAVALAEEDEVLGGTGLVEAGTYIAILAGTILAGLIPVEIAAIGVILVAIIYFGAKVVSKVFSPKQS